MPIHLVDEPNVGEQTQFTGVTRDILDKQMILCL